jgi:hypothetical protein
VLLGAAHLQVFRNTGIGTTMRPTEVFGLARSATVRSLYLLATLSVLAACDNGVGKSYVVGGTVGGLARGSLVLANGTDTVTVPFGAGAFSFQTLVASGSTYAATVRTQPGRGDACRAAN